MSSCCVECVSLSQYQCPFDNEFHLPQSRRRVELSTTSFSQFRRQILKHIDCLKTRSPAQFDADRRDCIQTDLTLVPLLLRFSRSLRGCMSSRSCRSLHVFRSCWPPDRDVQPMQLVRTWNRGNSNDSRNSYLFHAALISVSFRPLRCNSLQVNCGTHPAELSRKAISDSVVDPCSPRTSLVRQCVVTLLVFTHATLAHLGLFSFEPQPPSNHRSPFLVQHSLLGRSFRPCRTNTLTTIC